MGVVTDDDARLPAPLPLRERPSRRRQAAPGEGKTGAAPRLSLAGGLLGPRDVPSASPRTGSAERVRSHRLTG